MQLAMVHAEILCCQMQNDSSSFLNQRLEIDDEGDDKSFVLNNNMIMTTTPQSLHYYSSSSSNVFPESVKRESLWI